MVAVAQSGVAYVFTCVFTRVSGLTIHAHETNSLGCWLCNVRALVYVCWCARVIWVGDSRGGISEHSDFR